MSRFVLFALATILALTLTVPDSLRGQALWTPADPQAGRDQPDLLKLTLSPAEEPLPALEYRLLPTENERTPGNATTNYYRALLHLKSIPREHSERTSAPDVYEAWWDKPLDDAKVAAIKEYLAPYANVFAETKLAVYRSECEWNLGIEQLTGLDVISFLLHDFQEMREIARLLDLRARVELYEGRLDDAWETLRQLAQLGRDSAKPPLLINGLIGIAIESIMLRRLEDFIAHPDSPNVYWALTTLPEPVIDLSPAVEFEVSVGPRIFPGLNDPDRARTPEQWQEELSTTWKSLRSLSSQTSFGSDTSVPANLLEGAAAVAYAVTRYPMAKRLLIEAGRDEAEVDAMPVGQVLMTAEKIAYQRIYDEALKTYYLPMHARIAREADLDGRLKKLLEEEPIPIASILLPAVNSVAHAQHRLVYRVRGLQTIEAIRDYAAREGRFPSRLQDVDTLPVPIDPYTLENFSYESNGETATLRIIVPNVPQKGASKVYELTLRK